MPVSEQTFRQLALEDPEGHWEMYCGVPQRKPGMTLEHNYAMTELLGTLWQQLDRTQFDVRSNAGHVQHTAQNYFIPDVFVIPVALQTPLRGTRALESYDAPLPLVVEIWSPSTGGYDIEVKLREYQRRGDLEIWRIHPYDHTLTAWRRESDGSYTESRYTGGTVQPVALPNVIVDLDALFA
jgi:Uma2 family endonuclease